MKCSVGFGFYSQYSNLFTLNSKKTKKITDARGSNADVKIKNKF